MKIELDDIFDSPDADSSNAQSLNVTPGDFLYFDLETVPDWDRASLIDIEPVRADSKPVAAFCECPPALDVVDATISEVEEVIQKLNPDTEWLEAVLDAENSHAVANKKKVRKGVADAVSKCLKQRAEAAESVAKQQKELAVCPDLCHIVAYSWAVDGGEVQSVVVGDRDVTVETILVHFWRQVELAETVVGYNILAFDLPVIMVASIEQDVPTSRPLDLGKYSKGNVLDLFVRRFPNRWPPNAGSLKDQAKLLGIPIPAGDCNGSEVYRLWTDGDFEALHHYAKSDVQITRELHRRWRGYFV